MEVWIEALDLEEYERGECELTVEITEPEVVGVLYGPSGEVLSTLFNRTVVPFGFRPSAG